MHHWPETNESLILRVKDTADAASWSDFLAIYRPVVFRMACGRGLQHADADDLAQQVFLSVAKAIEDWQPDAKGPPFRAWLARITRNAIVNALTRQKLLQGSLTPHECDLVQEHLENCEHCHR